MTIKSPNAHQIRSLRALWKQAFGDTDAFLDGFFAAGYASDRCRVLCVDGQLAAALYWFDCAWKGQKLAYLYAVATDEAYRGRGLCRALMEDTHRHLQARGYAGAVLVPGSSGLFLLYEKLGYCTCSYVREFTCNAGPTPASLRRINGAEYAALRRKFLPAGGVLQEDAALAFLQTYAAFYAGENCLLAAALESGRLVVSELLGDPGAAPGILNALGAAQGSFRTPGTDRPFAMYHPLSGRPAPTYFGLALD